MAKHLAPANAVTVAKEFVAKRKEFAPVPAVKLPAPPVVFERTGFEVGAL